MDRARSRSRSPRRDRSAERDHRPRDRKQGGFRWKDKSSRRDRDDDDRDDRRGLQRGYRNRSRSRSRSPARRDARRGDGSRSPRRDRVRDADPRDRDWGRDRGRNDDRERGRDGARNDDRERGRDRDRGRDRGRDRDKDKESSKSDKKKTTAKPVKPGEELIVVYVNDRLGTKTAIPCLPSDPIGLFKIMVANRVGRKPNELLLKRQGERPFKDQLTLQDYGVSNGVQLDLEVDTGD
ncbi:hypothetical protein ACRALDRAFT_1074044 [Sodiomyces alcalophilus JCM 7366]|uniref:uncharacterized protein n=1 Tax=Sodiomyces alcalophilus JCM 7366 TaxID=591952 RepID=UPI0039B619D7